MSISHKNFQLTKPSKMEGKWRGKENGTKDYMLNNMNNQTTKQKQENSWKSKIVFVDISVMKWH